MNASQIYILISLIVLMIFALTITFFALKKKKIPRKVSSLTYVAFILVVLGTFFDSDIVLGYSLMGAGVIIAVVDIIKGRVKKK